MRKNYGKIVPINAALAPVGPRINTLGKFGPALHNNFSAHCAHALIVLLFPVPVPPWTINQICELVLTIEVSGIVNFLQNLIISCSTIMCSGRSALAISSLSSSALWSGNDFRFFSLFVKIVFFKFCVRRIIDMTCSSFSLGVGHPVLPRFLPWTGLTLSLCLFLT